MKKFLKKLITAQNSKEKLAKSLIIGTLFAFIVGFSTSEMVYYSVPGQGVNIISGELRYYNRPGQKSKRDFNESFIIIALIMGTSIGYLTIKENESIK